MTHRHTTNCAKNYCNRTLIVKVIVDVVTCFLERHIIALEIFLLSYLLTITVHQKRLSLMYG